MYMYFFKVESLYLHSVFLFLPFSFSSLYSTVSSLWTRDNINRDIIYFPFTSSNANPSLEGFIRFWTFVIAFQVLIIIIIIIIILLVHL